MLFANNHDATTLKERQTRFLSRVFVAVTLTGLGLTFLLSLDPQRRSPSRRLTRQPVSEEMTSAYQRQLQSGVTVLSPCPDCILEDGTKIEQWLFCQRCNPQAQSSFPHLLPRDPSRMMRRRNEFGERHGEIREELSALRKERNWIADEMTLLDKHIKKRKDSRELASHMKRLSVEVQATIASFFLYKDDAEKIPKFQHLGRMFPKWRVVHRVRVTGAPDANANGWYTRREIGYPVPSHQAAYLRKQVGRISWYSGDISLIPWYEKDYSDGTFRFICVDRNCRNNDNDAAWHIGTNDICLYHMWKRGSENRLYTPCNSGSFPMHTFWNDSQASGYIRSMISFGEERSSDDVAKFIKRVLELS